MAKIGHNAKAIGFKNGHFRSKSKIPKNMLTTFLGTR